MTTFALLLAAALTGQGVSARTVAPIRVTMAAPVARDGAVKAMATTWNCVGTLCTGPELNGRFGDARGCREIAKVTGTIAAYATARGELSADELAKCNKSAKKEG